MRAEEIAERAARRTGLADFGSDSWREGLEILLRSNAAAPPPPELLERVHGMYVDALANRLRVVDHRRAHPAVAAERVERPLFQMGMPRSGTSLTSYLLDRDPARRSLLLWEAWDSAPPATPATHRTDPRCLALLERQRAELAASPDRVRPHVEFADGPTECIRLHGQDFKALMWELYMPVREYSRWVMSADMTSAYEYQRDVMQVLQSGVPGEWSLKMPSHALHIEALLRVFPDARFVVLHRDPYRALGSLFSKKSLEWERLTGDGSVAWLREHYIEQLAETAQRPMRLRERIGDAAFYDLRYADLVRDPIAAMRDLYAWAGDEFSAAVEARMRAWLEQNPQGRFGKHQYDLEQFGLTVADLEPHFGEYVETYAIEAEG